MKASTSTQVSPCDDVIRFDQNRPRGGLNLNLLDSAFDLLLFNLYRVLVRVLTLFKIKILQLYLNLV